MHALHDRPYLRGECGDHLRHVSYFLSAATRPAFWAGPRARAQPLQRGAAAAAGQHALLARPRRGEHARSPTATSASGRTPTTWPRSSAGCRSSSRPTRGCRARSAATSSTSPRWSGGASRRGRSSRCRRSPPNELDRRIAAAVVERIPDGATLQAGIGGITDALLGSLTRAPRPRHPHRAALRRAHRPRRPGCGHRHAQAAAPPQGRHDVRARHPAALRLPAREPGRRVAAGRLRQRSRARSPGSATSSPSTPPPRST